MSISLSVRIAELARHPEHLVGAEPDSWLRKLYPEVKRWNPFVQEHLDEVVDVVWAHAAVAFSLEQLASGKLGRYAKSELRAIETWPAAALSGYEYRPSLILCDSEGIWMLQNDREGRPPYLTFPNLYFHRDVKSRHHNPNSFTASFPVQEICEWFSIDQTLRQYPRVVGTIYYGGDFGGETYAFYSVDVQNSDTSAYLETVQRVERKFGNSARFDLQKLTYPEFGSFLRTHTGYRPYSVLAKFKRDPRRLLEEVSVDATDILEPRGNTFELFLPDLSLATQELLQSPRSE